VPIEVLVTSHEDAAAGIAELWIGDRQFGSTRMDVDRMLVLEIGEGPWEVEVEDLHKALERMEDLLRWERPGVERVGRGD
jgi:hypothetical protein